MSSIKEMGNLSPALKICKIRLADRHLLRTAAYTKHDVPNNGISRHNFNNFCATIVTEAFSAEWQVLRRLRQQAVQLHATR